MLAVTTIPITTLCCGVPDSHNLLYGNDNG
jgi:hypothetical protein